MIKDIGHIEKQENNFHPTLNNKSQIPQKVMNSDYLDKSGVVT
jgi:hypothetical protein